ncbi:hypothetical protein [Paraflavitalea pollutisoli]|uniref:hypothetical protein n=1 Tax=Paraflavitalea pollutisoli TaxID=3034143 RepID=UPI0023EB732C|nr:hypothetical protein [Paraflavitalea sp. H1-2-19X]
MDEFRKYLYDHRDELDLEKPPRPQVWMHIKRETQEPPRKVIPLVLKWTAAAAAVVLVSLFTYQWFTPAGPATPKPALAEATEQPATSPELTGQVDSSVGTASNQEIDVPVVESPGETRSAPKPTERTNRKAAAPKEQPATSKATSPLKLIEDNYATIISYQLEKLEKTPIYIESAGYFHVFKKQWLDLERDEKKVKQDVRLYGLNDNLVNQLIQLYQQKLWLLKELQTEINKMNVRAKQYPDIQRPTPAYLKL